MELTNQLYNYSYNYDNNNINNDNDNNNNSNNNNNNNKSLYLSMVEKTDGNCTADVAMCYNNTVSVYFKYYKLR